MKFKAGDNIRVIENNLLGKIVGISFNSINQCDEYVVKWPHHQYEESYPVDECDSIWALEPCPVVDTYIKLPKPIDFIQFDFKVTGPVKVECNGYHTWIDVGFHHSKFVCKYCDVKRAD